MSLVPSYAMNYLSLNDLLDLHTFAVERYGGRLGIKSQDQLQGAIQAPRQIIFGEELYPDLAGKAAVLAFPILKNRPFIAGNEATALLAILRMLAINDASLGDTPVEDLADELRAVLDSRQDRDGLAAWLREHVQAEVERS